MRVSVPLPEITLTLTHFTFAHFSNWPIYTYLQQIFARQCDHTLRWW